MTGGFHLSPAIVQWRSFIRVAVGLPALPARLLGNEVLELDAEQLRLLAMVARSCAMEVSRIAFMRSATAMRSSESSA
jgi:hypothetical protein